MKLMKAAKKIGVSLVLLGVVYTPQAMATDLGTLSAVSTTNQIVDYAVSANSFTDIFNFTAGSDALASASVLSSYENAVTSTLNIAPYHGVEITGLELIDVSKNNFVVINDTTQVLGAPVVTTNTAHTVTYTTYSDNLSFSGVSLVKNDVYQLEVIGVGGKYLSAGTGDYTGSLTLAAVPEPEEWAMLLLGMPMVGWVVRRRQILA